MSIDAGNVKDKEGIFLIIADALLDDRGERPGVMFAEADLMGIPHRIVIGERGLAVSEVEYKGRTDVDAQSVSMNNIV